MKPPRNNMRFIGEKDLEHFNVFPTITGALLRYNLSGEKIAENAPPSCPQKGSCGS